VSVSTIHRIRCGPNTTNSPTNSFYWLIVVSSEIKRTGENLIKPAIPKSWQRIRGDGFFWYDTGQEHIITDSVFRNCGYRSDKYNQYDPSANRGCDDSDSNGCTDRSTVFGFLTHSDQFTPELMQGTRAITFDNCGRRFSLDNWLANQNTVSGRNQNWLDTDGSASGLGVPTLMVSGVANVSSWWQVDSNGALLTVSLLISSSFLLAFRFC
jgi:hypothetical protein